MPIPDAIQLNPIKPPLKARLGIPGSKSITNRALILAALSNGCITLKGALWSEDTQVMTSCLRQLGFDIQVQPDATDSANRTIQITGQNGFIPKTGTSEKPLELFVGNAGTAARFLLSMVCLGKGSYRLSGVPRMHERPQEELICALRELGYQIVTQNDHLPAVVHGQGPQQDAQCNVSMKGSSQFASSLLLSAAVGGWKITIPEDDAENAPYVEMTRAMVAGFPTEPEVDYQIEPDASGGSYFWSIKYLMHSILGNKLDDITVSAWPTTSWQIDTQFPKFWPLPTRVSRERDLGDSIMTAVIMAPWAKEPVTFEDLGRLRVQECERVEALRTELTKCGARVEEKGDSLTVYPGKLHGAEIETYNDHRIAMCFAVIGTQVPGMIIKNPDCVKKTFPNFFQKLASPAPEGLAMTICDASTGTRLNAIDLIA